MLDNSSLVNAIEYEFIKNGSRIDDDWTLQKADYLRKVFGLEILSAEGTTRCVFKKKFSRTVIKIGYPIHNLAEYSVSKALESTYLNELIANCDAVSKTGYVLSQEFIPRKLPEPTDPWLDTRWQKQRELLEEIFSFLLGEKDSLPDFHEDNLRVCHSGDIKIIDYSHLGYGIFMDKPKMTVDKAVRKLRKLEIPKNNIAFTYKSGIIHLVVNERRLSISS